MPYFLGEPKVRFVDNNGIALVNGTITTYSGGTTALLATYSTIADAQATTNPNTNPLPLDSRGEATIVLLDVAYKFVLSDAIGNIIWTVDNVYVTSGATVYDPNGNPIFIMTGTQLTIGAIDTSAITIGNSSTGSVTTTISGTNLTTGLSGGGISMSSSAALGFATPKLALLSNQPIVDSSGNNLIKFTKTTSAVNSVNISNTASGNPPTVSSAGSDTNIGITVSSKGTGIAKVAGTSSSINAANNVTIINSAGTYTWPTTRPTLGLRPIACDTSGNLAFTTMPGLFAYTCGVINISGSSFFSYIPQNNYNFNGVIVSGSGNVQLQFNYTSGSTTTANLIPVILCNLNYQGAPVAVSTSRQSTFTTVVLQSQLFSASADFTLILYVA